MAYAEGGAQVNGIVVYDSSALCFAERKTMSVKLWAYEPEKCDGDYCPNCCDICSKADADEEHIPTWLALDMLAKTLASRCDHDICEAIRTRDDDEILDI